MRSEVRMVASGLEVRSVSGGDIVLEGRPIVYNVDYQVHDMLGAFTERMAPTACDRVLERSDLDCRFLFNHDGMPLARTTSGTLELDNTAAALTCRAHLDDRSQLANDLAVAVDRGDVTQMSIGFITSKDSWNSDFTDRTVESLADLLDVSAVTYPASPTTTVGLAKRALYDMSREARDDVRRTYRMACDVREGAELSDDCVGYVINALERLYVVDDPATPVVRIREAFSVMRELRAGKKLSAANAGFIADAIASLAMADDVDIPDITRSLQSIDEAVDDARDALASVSGSPAPDDEDDSEPASVTGREDADVTEAREAEGDEAPDEEADAERRRVARERARAELALAKRRR